MVLKNMATNALTDSDKTSVLYITSEDKPVKIAQAMEKLAPELFKDPKLNERMIIYFNKDINIFDVQALVKQYPTDYVFIDYLQLIGLKSELPLTMKMLSKVIEDSNSI
jgi:predicted ATP-dependent serine protease